LFKEVAVDELVEGNDAITVPVDLAKNGFCKVSVTLALALKEVQQLVNPQFPVLVRINPRKLLPQLKNHALILSLPIQISLEHRSLVIFPQHQMIWQIIRGRA
jgi:hypothetical protein